MEENEWGFIISILKMPFILLLYLLYLVFSIFIPSRYVSRVINIEAVDKNIDFYINNPWILKMIAGIITVLVFTSLD